MLAVESDPLPQAGDVCGMKHANYDWRSRHALY